ncbi:S1/P1 Nuclease [Mesorhizobium sp. B1-1-6]|uniref:S1/P1 Nuclease n=1 Tax=Mesorhizobium sp. B1-1-6 TaxID=2589978 RepID=UPI0011268797|nr:S1/P1 Nuclease [Mesorhizobium sp. B1-1-6]TPN29155.1 S1/P1 Nuclease [Mesorhizobium sp. B1-1-6]
MAGKVQQDELDFSSLSVQDLIEARDQYHFHLMNKANVVGTAVGLYLIRHDEYYPSDPLPHVKKTYPRTFENSEVRGYSWPCILVLVDTWIDQDKFGSGDGKTAPWDAVPKRLYLADGRCVPVCTVYAPPVGQNETAPSAPRRLPQTTYGGGLRIHVKVQQQDYFATVGCLVTDGHLTYALTARHVCGPPGTEVQVELRQGLQRVGVSSSKQITRKLFSDVYPALPMRQTYLGLDVGLIRVDDVRDWTPNIYHLPPIRPLFDVYEQSLTLRKIIDQPVVAVGAASGILEGKIQGMFYRYRSVGGYDYVSDFLIAPGNGKPQTRHGDSGAVWFLASAKPQPDGTEDKTPLVKRHLRPLAVEWGAQTFADSGKRSSFSVATSLSTVCKILDVELVVENPTGVSGTWGALGHYSIGSMAVELVKDPTLKAFLRANADALSVPLNQLNKEPKQKDLLASGFVPLADVPDIVWKKYPSPHVTKKGQDIGVTGGRDTQPSGFSSTGPEHPNHHCDADVPFKGSPTLPDACLADPGLLTAANWNDYFDTFPEKVNTLHRGILPFRVWQIFERMKDYAANNPDEFIAAAGILAHYNGDSSQPLNGSVMADGIKDQEPDIPRDSSRTDKKTNAKLPAYRGEGVHSGYETEMINWAAGKGLLFDEIVKNLGADHGLKLATNGRDAALATLTTMRDVATLLPPTTIIDAYERTFHPDSPPHSEALWGEVGAETGKVMALGVRALAMIWDAAWTAGGGNKDHGKRKLKQLRALYENPNFLRSVTVNEIEQEIANPTPL